MGASSAWGNVREDTIDRILAIAPTFQGSQKWRHDTRLRSTDEEEDRGRTRQFRDDWRPGGDAAVFGSGEAQRARELILRTYYEIGPDLDDYLGHDNDDLIKALDPNGTYPSGTWGALKVRRVLEPEGLENLGGGVAAVNWIVRLVYRRPVTLA